MPRRRRGSRMPIDEKAIGGRLRQLRKQRGLTQTDVAKKLGINQSLVSQYERGELRMHGALVAAFARTLKTSADQILGLEKIEEDGLVRDRRFLRRLEKVQTLSKRDQQVLLRNLDVFLKGAGAHQG